MRRRRREGTLGNILFGATGWLFADLLLALAMAFLLASTTGQLLPGLPPTPTATPRPTCVPTAVPLPVLKLQPITLTIPIDAQGITFKNSTAIMKAESEIRNDTRLTGQRAGLVLSFGGTTASDYTAGKDLAVAFDTEVLTDLGNQGFVFYPANAVVYREFADIGVSPDIMTFDVYVFTQAAVATATPSTIVCV